MSEHVGSVGSVQCVVLDCPDPRALARFYSGLLGGEVDRPDPRWSLEDEWSTLHTPSGLVLAFQGVGDYRPPRWPDPSAPQQFHLDIGVHDLDAAEARALELGAVSLDDRGGARSWRVYADPVGHPFCLVRE
ncbi:VOC family protein [Streptomyces jeddahensis]|uniref:Glyoxalase-like domain protein n=1 Tax=Streptomyces jeddahensis TaxID=1716141 RepID=A0A177HI77_9ACTN|nr:VOC family protein [Streptomyces jeddahensis]OAH10662.1 glyoxalase-like domain protein [Streptomyces jeddahensis]